MSCKKDEATIPARTFLPATDIFETEEALTNVSGRIDLGKFEDLVAVYTEYNIGHYRRTFNLNSSRINQERIAADIRDGVLRLTLPKVEQAKPRNIQIT